MAINAAAQTVLDGRSALVGSWLEIEGLPNAYGTFTGTSALFAGRSTADQLLAIKPYLATLPKVIDQTIDTLKGGNLSVGQTIFEVLDKDGEPTDWTNITPPSTYLDTAITASTTGITISDATGISVGSYLYIGPETVKVTAMVGPALTVARGQFRSKALAFPSRFPIGLAPFTMANRRVWFYQAFDSGSKTVGTWSVTEATLDTNKVLRFSGILREFRLKDGEPSVYVLGADSVDREMDREVFRNLRSFRLSGTSIKDSDGTGTQPCQVSGWRGFTPGYDRIFNFDGSLFTANENLLLQIDNEIFAGTVISVAPGQIQLKARALFGTQPVVHQEGAMVKEVIPVCAKSNQTNTGQNVPWHELVSKFNAIPLYQGDVGPDHPVILALTVLCSTGAGTNYNAWGRNCDRLPADWGLGISHDRVDWETCEKAAREDPALRFGGLISEPINAVDFIRQLLVFAGYYFFVATGDLFTIRRLRPPFPDETTKTISNTYRIRNQASTWDANWSGAVREVSFKYAWDIVTGKYKRIAVFRINDADLYSKNVARTMSFESKLIYPGGSGVAGDLGARSFDVDAWLLHRRDYFKVRYGRPPPIVKERVDYSFLGVELGDLVIVTRDWMPDLAGNRNMSAVGEVIGKSVDDISRTVELTILMTGYSLGFYRYIAPSHVIQSVTFTGGSYLLEDMNVNTGYDKAIGNTTYTDEFFYTMGGTYFSWGDQAKLLLWTADFQTVEEVDILSYSHVSHDLEIAGPPSLTPAAGMIITPIEYDQDKPLYTTFAAFAVTSEIITGTEPHKLFPA